MCVLRGLKKILFLILGTVGFVLMVCLLLHSGAMILRRNVSHTPVVKTEEAILRFPMEIPGTTLVAHRIIRYEMERELPVAAIQLENTGTMEIECARVILSWEQGAYVFDVDALPSGMTVIVPERDMQPYENYFWIDCCGVQKSNPGR